MKKKFFTFACCIIIVFCSVEAFAVKIKLLDSKRYIRTKGEPNIYSDVFPGEDGIGKIIILNGNRDGTNRISSAKVLINNRLVFRTKDFNQKIFKLKKRVVLSESNTIKVKLNSKPGSFLTVSIIKNIDTDGAGVVGPGGGVVKVTDNDSDVFGTQISFEPNSLDKDTIISISGSLKEFQDVDQKFLYIHLEPSGLILNVPAKIEIPYDSSSVPDKELLFAYIYSPANPIKYGKSENSQWEHLNIFSATDSSFECELQHFSWITAGLRKPLYTILHIPGKYLKKSDLLFTLSDDDGNFDWFTGHVGIYLGTKTAADDLTVNDGETLIEAVPWEVKLHKNFTTFRNDDSIHLYMGARTCLDILTKKDRKKIATYAIDKEGYGYSPIGAGNFHEWFYSCAGLVEAAYDSADKNIMPELLEFPFILPVEQFIRTLPISDIFVNLGDIIEIPVRGVLLEDVPWANDRYHEISAEVTQINEESGMIFNDTNSTFFWQPTQTGFFSVNFKSSGTYNDNIYSREQYMRIIVDENNCSNPFCIKGDFATSHGGGTWGEILKIRGSVHYKTLTLAVTKGDLSPWQTSGTACFREGSFNGNEIGCDNTQENVTTFVTCEIDLSQLSGTFPKEFYVKYVPSGNTNAFAWAGPITVVENNN